MIKVKEDGKKINWMQVHRNFLVETQKMPVGGSKE